MKKKDGVLLKIIDTIAFFGTLISSIALVMSYFAPYTNPNTLWIFAFFGLTAPILYFVNLALLLYWMFRWKLMFALPAIVLLIGIGNVSTFYRLPLSKTYNETNQPNTIKIVSFNVEGFVKRNSNSNSSISTMTEIVEYIKSLDPDIICFQEYQSTPKNPQSKVDSLLKEWSHKQIEYFIKSKGRGVLGVATYSKFPIISHGVINFEQSNNGMIYSEIKTGKHDTLRVINNHLQTTNIDRSSLAFFDYDNFTNTKDKKAKVLSIVSRLRNGYKLRANQADTISDLIHGKDIATIVCGDFNDTPISYVYQTIRGDYKDSFEEVGTGYHYTYKSLFSMLRIDYILHSSDLETIYYTSPNVKWSDHNPVVATIKRKSN